MIPLAATGSLPMQTRVGAAVPQGPTWPLGPGTQHGHLVVFVGLVLGIPTRVVTVTEYSFGGHYSRNHVSSGAIRP